MDRLSEVPVSSNMELNLPVLLRLPLPGFGNILARVSPTSARAGLAGATEWSAMARLDCAAGSMVAPAIPATQSPCDESWDKESCLDASVQIDSHDKHFWYSSCTSILTDVCQYGCMNSTDSILNF